MTVALCVLFDCLTVSLSSCSTCVIKEIKAGGVAQRWFV